MKKNYQYDFDTPVERRETASMKWDKYQGRDIIPLWVADMDFKSAPAICEALHTRVDHCVFGYTKPPSELNDVVVEMLLTKYGWEIKPEWVVWLPGLVTGLNAVCRAIGRNGDDVITAVPAYPHFLSAPLHFHRNLINVPLRETSNHWDFDYNRFEQAIAPKTRLFMLCSPHNPVGRVYTREELSAIAKICDKHDLIICSDEIHCDLILDPDKKHVPTATLGASIAKRTITLMSASKTFNTPGLGCAFAVISDLELRQRFTKAIAGIVPMVNAMGFAATLAAFRDCADWHAELLDYLRGNRDLVEQMVAQIPAISMAPVEATYLAWIDVRNTGLKNPIKFFEDAGVGLMDGADFAGPGFVRLNFGCPRVTLEKALGRMVDALEGLKA